MCMEQRHNTAHGTCNMLPHMDWHGVLELRVEVHVHFRHEHGVGRGEACGVVLFVPPVQHESNLRTQLRCRSGTARSNLAREPGKGACIVVHNKVLRVLTAASMPKIWVKDSCPAMGKIIATLPQPSKAVMTLP